MRPSRQFKRDAQLLTVAPWRGIMSVQTILPKVNLQKDQHDDDGLLDSDTHKIRRSELQAVQEELKYQHI